MLEPYRMIVVNLIASGILGCGLIFYKYIYPKKNIPLSLILIIVSILPLISILRKGTYESGDLSIHVPRAMSFYNMLFVEHIIPRWFPQMNAGYGDPTFIFSYFFPYVISSIFHAIGFSFINSLKLLLVLSFILSGLTMYLWAKEDLGNTSGFVSAIFYLFVPYHLVDMHFRASIAETFSFIFPPLILYLSKKIIENESMIWGILMSLSFALLMLSHQAIFAIFFPITISYSFLIWYRKKDRKIRDIIRLFLFIALGLLISAFYWVPIIFESQFTQLQKVSNNTITYTSLSQLFYSPWRFGLLFQGHQGEQSYLIGYTQWLSIIISIFLVIKTKLEKKIKKLLIFFLIVFFSFLFLMLPLSKALWQIIPLFRYFEFSYRLLVVLALCTSIIAGIVVKKINRKWFVVGLVLLTIVYTILNWGNRRTIPEIDDQYLINEFMDKPEISQGILPTAPIWINPKRVNYFKKPSLPIEVLKGNADIKELFRSSMEHTYIINAKNSVVVKENTLYFPGWKIKINNADYPFNYTSNLYPGIIIFNLNPGLYKTNVSFTNTRIRTISLAITIFSFIALLALLVKVIFSKKFRED